MPNYSFVCEEHGSFTISRSINDESPVKCPHEDCKCEPKRVYSSAVGYVAKCGGFYGKVSK